MVRLNPFRTTPLTANPDKRRADQAKRKKQKQRPQRTLGFGRKWKDTAQKRTAGRYRADQTKQQELKDRQKRTLGFGRKWKDTAQQRTAGRYRADQTKQQELKDRQKRTLGFGRKWKDTAQQRTADRYRAGTKDPLATQKPRGGFLSRFTSSRKSTSSPNLFSETGSRSILSGQSRPRLGGIQARGSSPSDYISKGGMLNTAFARQTTYAVIDSKQRALRNKLKEMERRIPDMNTKFVRWMADQRMACDQFMKTPDERFLSTANAFVKAVREVYQNGFFSSVRITVFDYDAYTHGVTQGVLKTLSLIHSAMSFYNNDKGMGRTLGDLIKEIHSLYVLATCDTYFGKETRAYVAARERGALDRAKQVVKSLESSSKLRVKSQYINKNIVALFSK